MSSRLSCALLRFASPFAVLALAAGCSQPRPPTGPSLQPGTRLVYQVESEGGPYPFLVDVEATAPQAVFQYTFDPGGRGLSGRVVLTPNAQATATRLHTDFGGGDLTLEDATTVWASDTVYDALRRRRAVEVDLGSGAETLEYVDTVPYAVQVQGQPAELRAFHGTTAAGHALWVWDNAANPLVLRLEERFTVALQEIW
ncbi:MAG TPA: hypothetical protein VD962_12835 [Rubricoccaceae bacterium]|nr:hypothetical protein [Rubricoccaceae bacterium]